MKILSMILKLASEIFKNKLGYVPNIFSYPFGEFSKFMKDYISKKFDTAFGQHSGIIDKIKINMNFLDFQ